MSGFFDKIEIPYGAYWSTPFAKWQGAFAHLNAFEFAAWIARNELGRRKLDAKAIDFALFGSTIIQHKSFYGVPWVTGLAGLPAVTGPTISQACATGTRLLANGTLEIAGGMSRVSLLLAGERCSNGPHVYYPDPGMMGGTGPAENWVIDNFERDPLGGHSMLTTAENVAAKHGISTAEQHEAVLQRLTQYGEALKSDRAFQRRFMTLPFEVPRRDFSRIQGTIDGDEGVFQSTVEGLAKLKPVRSGGTVTFGGQTHPADGSAAMIMAHADAAKAFSANPGIRIRPVSFAQARAALGFMPEAPVPAARLALQRAGIKPADLAAVKTHNPFALNDIILARELPFPLERINNYGCSLVWGHPHAATALRSIIELIEELVLHGGGYGLFAGCAAGDSAMAMVLKVESR